MIQSDSGVAELESRLVDSLRKTLPKAKDIGVDRRFREDLGADSLDMATLVMELEGAFGFLLDDKDAASVLTVGDALSPIRRRLAQGAADA